MRVSLLGPVEIESDLGQERISSSKLRTLLALLAINAQRSVSLDTLLTELWLDDKVRNPKNACHATVSRLRRILEPAYGGPCLQTTGSGYRLALSPDDVDALHYENHIKEAKSLGESHPEDGICLIDRANKLWNGSALEDVDDVPILNVEKDRLDDLYLASLEMRAGFLLAAGNTRLVISSLSVLSQRHVGRERIHEQLMVALYREGRQLDALNVYQRVARRLNEEFGISPGPRLRGLQQAVLNHDELDRHVGNYAH